MRVALVTGGAVRIGHAITQALAQSYDTVAIQYRLSKSHAENAVRDILTVGGQAVCFKANLEQPTDLQRLIDQVETLFGSIDCLINNASMFEDDDFSTMSVDSFDKHLAVNLRAPVFLSQAMAQKRKAGQGVGNVINIIDQRVLHPNPLFFSYTLSKSALWSATKTMAQALAPHIRVNAISPGPVLKSVHQTEQDFKQECETMPLGQGTTPQEIADAVMFILRSSSMTGQMLTLDGGQHLLWQTPDLRVT